MAQAPWCTRSVDEVVDETGANLERGLSAEEAQRRLTQFGRNQLEDKKATPKWRLFVAQFQDFMIYVLLAAVAIAAWEGQIVECIAILAILLLNGVLGFIQEFRAEQALAALKEMSAPTASVLRDGVEVEIETSQLVVGDIVFLEAGDTVPADGRLFEVGAMRTVEAALTGESEAVRKQTEPIISETASSIPLGDMKNIAFSGTSVSVGHAKMIVVETGSRTEMGKIAVMLNETAEDPTPIQVELDRVGKRIAIAVLIIAAAVFIEEVLVTKQLTEGLLIAVSLAVAAIPEGLPAIVTVALSMGVRRMAEHNAIVKKLHAVETLGSTDFICSDKTGTLTLNKMTVRRFLAGVEPLVAKEGTLTTPDGAMRDPHEDAIELLLAIGVGCNDAHFTAQGELVGDPTETALIAAAHDLGVSPEIGERIAEVPFDSERKRMTTVHRLPSGEGEKVRAFMKGGVDTTLPLCNHALMLGNIVELTDELRDQILESNTSFAAQGFRTLAFAYRELPASFSGSDEELARIESDFIYVGVMALQDPARAEVPASVRTAHEAGITVAMVTGDHALTARAIADEIGILDGGGEVVSGPEIEAMSDEELRERVEKIRVYARVNPEHKLRIVAALKSRDHIVAMTGDGVNDAPALKRADIGVAMGVVGTDVTREAADMVLADDNFATIVEAVGLGRSVFDNLKKVILFLLSCNISEVVIIALSSFISPALTLLPLQILWINLITDGLPALALGVDPAEEGIMKRAPRNAGEPILTGKRWAQILWQGVVLSIFPLILSIVIAPRIGASHETARTMLFTTLVLSQLLHSLSFRSQTRTVFSPRSLKNKWLIGAIGMSLVFQLLLIYIPGTEALFKVTPLGLTDWVAVVAVTLCSLAVNDITKRFFNREK